MKSKKIISAVLTLLLLVQMFVGNISYAVENRYAKTYELSNYDSCLSVSEVTDPSFLENEKILTDIEISNSTITEDYHFEYLTKLERIAFKNCVFETDSLDFADVTADPSRVYGVKLEFDECEFNAGDISLPYIVDDLKFTKNIFKKFSPLWLRNLEINNYNLDDLTLLSGLKQLDGLSIRCSNLGSLKGIEKQPELQYVILDWVNVESIKRLEKLENLQTICLNNTFVKDISSLINIKKLVNIDISGLTIESLEPLLAFKDKPNMYINVKNVDPNAVSKQVFDYLNSIDSDMTKDYTPEMKQKIIDIKNSIIKDDMSDIEKIKAIVEYVDGSIEYDYDAVAYGDEDTDVYELSSEYNKRRLYYSLTEKGICINYTALTTVLLKMCNINTYEILNEDHIWNYVELNGKYYWLDTTYTDTEMEICDLIDCPSFMSQDDEEFINNRCPYVIPPLIYNKLHNLPEDDFKDLEEPQESVPAISDNVKQQFTPKKQFAPKIIYIVAGVAGLSFVVMIVSIILLARLKSKKRTIETEDFKDK